MSKTKEPSATRLLLRSKPEARLHRHLGEKIDDDNDDELHLFHVLVLVLLVVSGFSFLSLLSLCLLLFLGTKTTRFPPPDYFLRRIAVVVVVCENLRRSRAASSHRTSSSSSENHRSFRRPVRRRRSTRTARTKSIARNFATESETVCSINVFGKVVVVFVVVVAQRRPEKYIRSTETRRGNAEAFGGPRAGGRRTSRGGAPWS